MGGDFLIGEGMGEGMGEGLGEAATNGGGAFLPKVLGGKGGIGGWATRGGTAASTRPDANKAARNAERRSIIIGLLQPGLWGDSVSVLV